MGIKMFPSEWAVILGTSQRDIWEWVFAGSLKYEKVGKKSYTISVQDMTNFLIENPSNIGRLYCDDIILFYNKIRHIIIEQIERQYENANNKSGCA